MQTYQHYGCLVNHRVIFHFQQKVDLNLEFSHLCSVKDHIWDTDYRPVSSTEATYDWEFRVKDVNGGEMKHYIEKVIINLHETFPEPIKSKFKVGNDFVSI